jgi:SRSO17 transposase
VARRTKAGVPEDIEFKTKPQIALEQIRWACEVGLPRGVVIIDAGYGVEAKFRSEISTLALKYVAGVKTTTTVWAPDIVSQQPDNAGRRSRSARTAHADASAPISVEKLALTLPKSSWRTIVWRDGTNAVLSSRFARVRVRSAHDRDAAKETVPKEWLLIEWPPDEEAPTKFWLSTLRANITFAHLVCTAKLRWQIERDYLELKQEIGLGHFEGRGWRGFHHHATLCIAAHAFLVAERAASPLTSALRHDRRNACPSRRSPPTGSCQSVPSVTRRTRLRLSGVRSPCTS